MAIDFIREHDRGDGRAAADPVGGGGSWLPRGEPKAVVGVLKFSVSGLARITRTDSRGRSGNAAQLLRGRTPRQQDRLSSKTSAVNCLLRETQRAMARNFLTSFVRPPNNRFAFLTCRRNSSDPTVYPESLHLVVCLES